MGLTVEAAVAYAWVALQRHRRDPLRLAEAISTVVDHYGKPRAAEILEVSHSTLDIWRKLWGLPEGFKRLVQEEHSTPLLLIALPPLFRTKPRL